MHLLVSHCLVHHKQPKTGACASAPVPHSLTATQLAKPATRMRDPDSVDPSLGVPIYHGVYARVGLLGNPSDGFFGKTISLSLANFCAEVCCKKPCLFAFSEVAHLLIVCLSSTPGNAEALRQAVLQSPPTPRWRRVRLTGRAGAPPGGRRLWGWNPPLEGALLPATQPRRSFEVCGSIVNTQGDSKTAL